MRPSLRAVSVLGFLAFGFSLQQARAAGILAPAEAGVPPLEIRVHQVEASIADQVARTRVKQTFFNPAPRQLEAHYLFPVPKGAQVTDFVLYMNGEAVKAEVVEKEKAAAIYEDIVRRMKDPGILEYLDRDLYRIRVFPVPAQGEVKIEIEFSQVLPSEGGAVTYTYPGSVPGYPGGSASNLDLQFSIDSKAPIRSIYSPTHAIRFDSKQESNARGRLVPGGGDQDATIIYTLSKDDIGLNALAYRPDGGEDGFFLILVSPKFDFKESEIQPKAVTFVLDTSGSMAADGKIDQAKAALKYCLNSLKPKDFFNIVRFESTVDNFADSLIPADKKTIADAQKWVDKFSASGGTNIDDALRSALQDIPPKGSVHTIAFLTDGLPTVGTTDPKAILDNLRRSNEAGLRVFSFGVGFDVNVPLLDNVAEETRALSQYIKPKEDIEVAVSSFFDKVSNPVLTGCELEIEGVKTADIYPVKLPDLFIGSQLTVLGRYEGAGEANIELRGRFGEREEKFAFKTSFPKEDGERDYIEPLWGQRRIGYLLDEIRLHGENKELVDEVIELSKRYGIATPYTSLLATEDTAVAQARQNQMLKVLRTNRKAGGGKGTPSAGQPVFRTVPDVIVGDGEDNVGFTTDNNAFRHMNDQLNLASELPNSPGSGFYDPSNGTVSFGSVVSSQKSAPFSTAHAYTYDPSNGTVSDGDAFRVAQGGAGGPWSTSNAEALTIDRPAGDLNFGVDAKQRATISGQGAVAASEDIAARKRGETLQKKSAVQEKKASGRQFVLKDGVWIDKTIEKREKTLEVKFASDAWFALLKRRPDLKDALKIGGEIEIRLDATTVLRIGAKGKEKLEPADEALLEKSKPAKK